LNTGRGDLGSTEPIRLANMGCRSINQDEFTPLAL
jgi:hypothetical protein